MSKESHSFSVSVACQVGVNSAIMLQHFIFLQRFSPDGWVKKSAKAIQETYPYLTEKEIRGSIERLCKDGHIFSKIENAIKADRTKSFFVSESGHKLYDTEPFDKRANGVTERANGFDKKANDNFPKGQMLIKEDCIINSSFVGGDAPTPDGETFSLNAPFREVPAGPQPAGQGRAMSHALQKAFNEYIEEAFDETLDAEPIKSSFQAGPHIRDYVKADLPGEMLDRIAAFYATPQGQKERERIYSDTIAGKMTPAQRTEVTKAFAAWAVEQNYGQKTFRELNARFTRWWKDQARYNANQAQQSNPLNNRPDGPKMRSSDNPYANHKIIS